MRRSCGENKLYHCDRVYRQNLCPLTIATLIDHHRTYGKHKDNLDMRMLGVAAIIKSRLKQRGRDWNHH